MTERIVGAQDAVTLERAIERIGELVSHIEAHAEDDLVRLVFELLDWIDTLHREGLERLVGGLMSAGLVDRALDDPVVAHLFAIYGLVDATAAEQDVLGALDEIRPYVQSHGGEMTLASIEGGVVSVRLLGACDGCPSAVVTLTQSLDRAIRQRWPGLVRIDVVDEPPEPEWTPVMLRPQR